jgi:hypothetical protein
MVLATSVLANNYLFGAKAPCAVAQEQFRFCQKASGPPPKNRQYNFNFIPTVYRGSFAQKGEVLCGRELRT